MDKRCGTCRHWNARLSKTGNRIVSHDPHYACLCPFPELPTLPASIRMGNSFGMFQWPPSRGCMGKDQGKDCKLWEEWKREPRS